MHADYVLQELPTTAEELVYCVPGVKQLLRYLDIGIGWEAAQA